MLSAGEMIHDIIQQQNYTVTGNGHVIGISTPCYYNYQTTANSILSQITSSLLTAMSIQNPKQENIAHIHLIWNCILCQYMIYIIWF
jgi:hypothetical protein